LVALPALLGELCRRFAPSAKQHARDQLCFARVAAKGLERSRAIALAQAAVETDVRGELTAHALYFLGEQELAQGALEAAIQAFEGAAEASASDFDRARAHLALAKLFEHKRKATQRALEHAAHTLACEGEDAHSRRIARLTARLSRQATLRA